MKKILLMAAAIATLTGCTNDLDQIEKSETEYGTIVLSMGADTDVALTRTVQNVTDFSNWEVQILKKEDKSSVIGWKSYNEYSEDDWKQPYGTYTVEVRNNNGSFSNNEKGKEAYEGSADVTVSAATNKVTVNCGTQKTSQVAVKFTDAFTNTFTGYAIAVTDANVSGRTFSADQSTDGNEVLAYLLPNGSTKAGVTYRLIGTLNGQSGQKVLAQITEPIRIDPATKLVLNVNASSTNGKITLTITYDDTVTTQEQTITVDPTDWNTFQDANPSN